MSVERPTISTPQEELFKQGEDVRKKIYIDFLMAQVPAGIALATGGILLAIGERLSPQTRIALGRIFLANVILFTGLRIMSLYRLMTEHKKLLAPDPNIQTLDQALETLETPLTDEELVPVMRKALALARGTPLSLGPGGSEVLLLPGEDSGEAPLSGAVTIFEDLQPTQVAIIKERLSALTRVSEEFTERERRRAFSADQQRLKILEALHLRITAGDLFEHPEVALELRTAATANLIEGSPPVLAKMVEIIRTVFIELIARESKRTEIMQSPRMEPVHESALSVAINLGVDIPGHFEAKLLRRNMPRIRNLSFLDSGPFSPRDVEALVWSLGSAYLRPMSEVREPAREAILTIKHSFSRLPSKGRLDKVGKRILKILEFEEKIPSLGLGISVHELAQRNRLSGASSDFVPAESLGLDGRLGLTALVTLPKNGEISPNTLADILTWASVRYPFAGSFAVARGPITVFNYGLSASRTNKPTNETMEEIRMLFRGGDVLDWLLDGRDPDDLSIMNLRRQEAVPEGHLLMQANL